MLQKDSLCEVFGCQNQARANFMCQKHNMRSWRGKDLHSAGTYRGTATKFIRDHINYQSDECLIWPFARVPTGYGDVNYPKIRGQAHRVMCILAHGPPPTKNHEAAHSCGKGHEGCINPKHLSWKTRIENIYDKTKHGTQLWGEGVHFAKLTVEQAMVIKYGNEKPVTLADRFNVHTATIHNIRSGRTWKGI